MKLKNFVTYECRYYVVTTEANINYYFRQTFITNETYLFHYLFIVFFYQSKILESFFIDESWNSVFFNAKLNPDIRTIVNALYLKQQFE